MQNVELTAAGRFGAAISEVDDLTLPDAVNGRVRLFDETFQAFRKPMITARLLAVSVHSLLDHDPLAIVGHDEAVKIKVEAVLHGGAVHFGDEPAGSCQCRPVKSHTLPD